MGLLRKCRWMCRGMGVWGLGCGSYLGTVLRWCILWMRRAFRGGGGLLVCLWGLGIGMIGLARVRELMWS